MSPDPLRPSGILRVSKKQDPFARKTRSVSWVGGAGAILYHVTVILLSAGLALSLPSTAAFLARSFLVHWSFIENEKIFLISIEIVLSMLLVLLFHHIRRSWTDRKMAKMARSAGMVHFFPTRGLFAQGTIRKWKERHGSVRDIMIIGSTGFRTFVDPKGDLHRVIRNCREARIILLNPCSEGSSARAKSILDPNVTPDSLRKQIMASIEFLKTLNPAPKVRLKLYDDAPFLKLAILGDYIFMKHYHAGLDVQMMPEYVFRHDQNPGSLYTPLY